LAPIMRCRLLPPEAAEQAVDRWAWCCPVHRPRVKVVKGVGGGQDLARCLAPGDRDGLKESIDLLPERAAVGMAESHLLTRSADWGGRERERP
jgi:hypothetical protein